MPATGVVSTEGGLREVPPCPLGEEVLRWVVERLWTQGVHRPTCKRLALLVGGLLETATVRTGEVDGGGGAPAAERGDGAEQSPGGLSGSWTTRNWIPSGSCRR